MTPRPWGCGVSPECSSRKLRSLAPGYLKGAMSVPRCFVAGDVAARYTLCFVPQWRGSVCVCVCLALLPTNLSPSLQPASGSAEERHLKESGGHAGDGGTSTNPFLSSPCDVPPAASGEAILDLFSSGAADLSGTSGKASDDLLCLGNPFAEAGGAATGASPFAADRIQSPPLQSQPAFAQFTANGFMSKPVTTPSGPGVFASDASFAAAFGGSPSTGTPACVWRLSHCATFGSN
ncbi:unnamed protein product, partial [Ixodes pacificus]